MNTLVSSSYRLHSPKITGDVGYDMELSEDVTLGPRTLVNPLQHWSREVQIRLEGGEYVHKLKLWLQVAVIFFFGYPPPSPMAMAKTSIRVHIPPGMWATMLPRSSTNKKGVIIAGSVIDEGYRGELFPILHNMTNRPVSFKKGDRVAQLILLPATAPLLEFGDVKTTTARGVNGFGSTGD